MDEILASIRRIIESGEEKEERGARAALLKADGTAFASESPAESIAGKADLPHFDVHYLPNAMHEEAPEDASAARVAEPIDDRSTVEIHTSDPHESEYRAADAEPEAVDSDDDDYADDAWWDAAVAADREQEAKVDDREREEPAAVVTPIVPQPGNENAAAGPFPELRGSRDISSRDFAREFDDLAFETALRRDAWKDARTTAQVAEPVPPVSEAPPRQPRSEMPESVIAGASALLSAQAGDQVAAAFDDLTQAIRDGQMHSMEDMAREMMRPMLQEWLDDNLPRIVERLVRDEIERIARGPRR